MGHNGTEQRTQHLLIGVQCADWDPFSIQGKLNQLHKVNWVGRPTPWDEGAMGSCHSVKD